MNPSPHDDGLAAQLKAGFGELPVPNFKGWCARYPETASLPPVTMVISPSARQKRKSVTATLKWIAASLLVAAGLVWSRSEPTLGRNAFAEAIPGIDDAQTITWTQTAFARVTSQDGQRTWLRKYVVLCAYRHPGQYRETHLNAAGEPDVVRITDVRSRRTLEFNPRSKKAILTTSLTPRDVRGPFAPYGDMLRRTDKSVKSVSLRGQKVFDGKKVNVVRVVVDAGEGFESIFYDMMFDSESKQFAGVLATQGNGDFDPDTATDRDHVAEKDWSRQTTWGSVENEIVLDSKIDRTLFSLDPPAGFEIEMIAKPTVTEEEMTAFLGASARLNDGVFPDSPFEWNPTKAQAIEAKAPADRTAREQEALEQMNDLRIQFGIRQIHLVPTRVFVDEHAAPDSFHYVGSEVKLGSADTIVCWYKFRNATKYRAVFGDLSVKDVTKTELPLDFSK